MSLIQVKSSVIKFVSTQLFLMFTLLDPSARIGNKYIISQHVTLWSFIATVDYNGVLGLNINSKEHKHSLLTSDTPFEIPTIQLSNIDQSVKFEQIFSEKFSF